MSAKYNIVKPKFSDLERGSVILLFNFLIIASIVSIALQFTTSKVPLILAIAFLIVTITIYFIGKRILSFDIQAIMSFKSDQLEIQTGESIKILPYRQIEKIEYCGNIPDSIILKSTSNHKTYLIKIEDVNLNIVLVEVTKESIGIVKNEGNGTREYIEQTIINTIPDAKIFFNSKIKVYNNSKKSSNQPT